MTTSKNNIMGCIGNLILAIMLLFFSYDGMAYAGRSDSQINSGPYINRGNNHEIGAQLLSPLDDYGTINISWTAPGDDSTFGRADHYSIKYSLSTIDESNWALADSVPNPPNPMDGGEIQDFQVTGLYPGAVYFLAIKTYDDAGNVSPLSNVASDYASGIPRPIPLEALIDTINTAATVYARVVNSHLAVYYEFQLDTSMAFTAPRVDVAFMADTAASVTFGSLQNDIDYFWRCRAMAQDHSDSSYWSDIGSFSITMTDIGTPGEDNAIPDEYMLKQSYPNPFNAEATIPYSLPTASHVTLEIYDLLGNLILTAIDGNQDAGAHQYIWRANQTPSGTYLYRIKAGQFEKVRKMTLLK